MLRILTVQDIAKLISEKGTENSLSDIINCLANDFKQWDDFQKQPRIASHFPHGVIELMPICNQTHYAFKYVNGHPENPKQDLQTVIAFGTLADVQTGYPLMICDMTLLTALRTAATSALAAKYLARKNSKIMAMIGTGSQSEFQVLAHHVALGLETIQYFDIDPIAMKKFEQNLSGFNLRLIPCKNTQTAINGADIITTATADKLQAKILQDDWIKPGLHINGVGGDCPGKTEMDPALLHRAKIVVEFLEQTKLEGEIQNLNTDIVYAELWELVSDKKVGRTDEQEVTFFDSVGFAIEDYSILNYFYEQANHMDLGEQVNLVPELNDPKNLFSLIK